MKFFPESWVSDPDKKINPSDTSLINKIITSLLESDKKLRLTKQEYVESNQFHYGNYCVAHFKKDKKDKAVVFRKVSIYEKKSFFNELDIVNSFIRAMNSSDDDVINKTKKLVGIRIEVNGKDEGFAVNSVDGFYNDSTINNKLWNYANQNLDLYCKWIKKHL